jgi:ribosomal-protein-serine acetyltransferase
LMFSRIVAPGLELRQIEERDAPAIYAVIERNREYLDPWLPWVQHTHSPADVVEFIRHVGPRCQAGDEVHAGIWLDGAISGVIGHHPVDWNNHTTAIGYWLDQCCQGRGIITRCCHALLDYLFDEVHLHRVEIRCATGNHRSCAVPERLGFQREGVLRHAELGARGWLDLVVWAILEHEWRKH